MAAKNNNTKKLRNRCIILWGIITISVLLYKNYDDFHVLKIKNNKVISANEMAKNKVYKNQSLQKYDTGDSEKNTNEVIDEEEQYTKEDSTADEVNLFDIMESNIKKNLFNNGKEYTYDAQKVKDILDNKFQSDGEKIAFLTFDDGPSASVTPEILNTLKNYDIKATFFLVGQNIEASEKSKELVKQIFQEGHAIGNHTYSHNMKKLYPGNTLDVNYLMGEVEQTDTNIKNIVGQDFNTRILRLPGGYMSRVYYDDPNLNELNERLKEKDMYSIDWNAYDFDAEGRRKNAEELLQYVKESVGTQEKVIILMHDTYGKEETAKALPQIIEYLKNEGYEFKTIS